ncbi:MAG: transposase [Planctomycetes bacterium]|nr:transposase [Planctomycetota bacterium]
MLFTQKLNESPYCLRFAYTTWLTHEVPKTSIQLAVQRAQVELQASEINLLEHRIADNQIQLLLSTKPTHSPTFIARVTKVKMSAALSAQNHNQVLKREFSLRSVGENTTKDLLSYLQKQVLRRKFVDDRFSDSLTPFSRAYKLTPGECQKTSYGYYWYDLHLVLGTTDRYCVAEERVWKAIVEATENWHQELGYQINSISLLPDHVHLLNRPCINTSPQQVGEGLVERLNRIPIMQNIYRPTFYVATHGVYAMNAVRNLLRAKSEG